MSIGVVLCPANNCELDDLSFTFRFLSEVSKDMEYMNYVVFTAESPREGGFTVIQKRSHTVLDSPL